ncbi:hypothetical protein [Streptomyces iconiensis]|uniref:Uncharacterized protein n=1 Tax=Streptomyces iconiensis TaxID=1384038 RepID=A0ABT6ZTP9_9ACTN|nr:hypothetical protein [Streptomyces iconiensis]MDJ1132438.1 hypothetical protein [Streptomyces iconiensis]
MAILCLSTSVYSAGFIPTLLVGTEPPAWLLSAVARTADTAAHTRQRVALDVCALALLLSLDPAKGVTHA